MTKFEEMRLRAVKFQELTKCCLEIYGDADYFLLHHHSETGIKQPDFSFQQIGDELRFCKVGSPRPAIDSDLSIPESDWLAGIEKVFGRPFTTLLEAQGWIELVSEDQNYPREEVLCIDSDGFMLWGTLSYDKYEGGFFAQYAEGFGGHVGITHCMNTPFGSMSQSHE